MTASEIGSWEWQLTTDAFTWSETQERLFGFSPGSFDGKQATAIEKIHPEDRDRVLQTIEQAKIEGTAYKVEFRVLRTNGQVRWLCSRGKVTCNADGDPICLVGSDYDITADKQAQTDLKQACEQLKALLENRDRDLSQTKRQLQQAFVRGEQAEKALWENQHFIQRIAAAIPNALYVYDLNEQRNIYTNCEIATLLGYQPEAIQQMGSNWFQQLVHPDDRSTAPDPFQSFQTAREGDIFEREYRLKDANGEWRWFVNRDTLFNRNEDGTPRQIVGTATDITERKRAEEALQQANQQLTSWVNELELRNQEQVLLAEMSDFLQACLTLEEAYGAIAKLLQPLFPGCSGGVFAIGESRTLVEVAATWGEPVASQVMFESQECWALRRGRAHQAERSHPRLFCPHCHLDPLPAESLCMPMMAQGEALGLLALISPEPGVLTAAKQQLATTVAEHLALSLANLRLRQTLHRQSIRDPLTGLFNRRYLEDSLEQAVHRARRKQEPLGIAMVDIDRFKQFNDRFGHEAGDLVLRHLGQFLQAHIRHSDIACRYGGEELLLILPDASLDGAQERAEQLRQGTKCLNIVYQGQPLNITISIGVACYPDHGLTEDALIRAADKALYQAKASGRDCIAIASC